MICFCSILELLLFLNNQEKCFGEKSANSLEKKTREGEKIWNWPLDWNVGFKVWIQLLYCSGLQVNLNRKVEN